MLYERHKEKMVMVTIIIITTCVYRQMWEQRTRLAEELV